MILKSLRENLILKIVSLFASLSLWLYVRADQLPAAMYSRSVNADVVRTGTTPEDMIVRIRQEPLPVEITGPQAEVDSIDDGEVKAEVDLTGAKAGISQLKIVRYTKPQDAPSVVIKGRPYVSVDVLPRARKQMPVTAMFSASTGPATRYTTPRIRPEWAYVSGAADDVKRVARLVVSVETSGRAVNADLPIRAEDRDNVEISGVDITPRSAHVEVPLEQPPATRSLVVNVQHRGKPASGHILTEVIAEPSTVTVVGKPEQIQALSNVMTRDIDIEGLAGERSMNVNLSPPDGVGVAGGRPSVRVTFRTQQVAPAPTPGSP